MTDYLGASKAVNSKIDELKAENERLELKLERLGKLYESDHSNLCKEVERLQGRLKAEYAKGYNDGLNDGGAFETRLGWKA